MLYKTGVFSIFSMEDGKIENNITLEESQVLLWHAVFPQSKCKTLAHNKSCTLVLAVIKQAGSQTLFECYAISNVIELILTTSLEVDSNTTRKFTFDAASNRLACLGTIHNINCGSNGRVELLYTGRKSIC